MSDVLPPAARPGRGSRVGLVAVWAVAFWFLVGASIDLATNGNCGPDDHRTACGSWSRPWTEGIDDLALIVGGILAILAGVWEVRRFERIEAFDASQPARGSDKQSSK